MGPPLVQEVVGGRGSGRRVLYEGWGMARSAGWVLTKAEDAVGMRGQVHVGGPVIGRHDTHATRVSGEAVGANGGVGIEGEMGYGMGESLSVGGVTAAKALVLLAIGVQVPICLIR